MTTQDKNYNDADCRIGEQNIPTTFRTNRFFVAGSSWYFSTREGEDQGPFESRILAHDAIQRYIRDRQFVV